MDCTNQSNSPISEILGSDRTRLNLIGCRNAPEEGKVHKPAKDTA